jgi:hypothetical protein
MLREHYTVNADVLFVGLNPSFSEDGIKKMASAMKVSADEMMAILRWPAAPRNIESQQLARAAASETSAKELYVKYFKPLADFCHTVNAVSHCHLDVLLLRHTSQKSIIASYGEYYPQMRNVPFIEEQIRLFEWALKAMSPRVVVVANAKASDVVIEALPLETNDDGRSYRWSQLPGVPFFLSGMLSGQRALDKHSRRRLEIDVADALKGARAHGAQGSAKDTALPQLISAT